MDERHKRDLIAVKKMATRYAGFKRWSDRKLQDGLERLEQLSHEKLLVKSDEIARRNRSLKWLGHENGLRGV